MKMTNSDRERAREWVLKQGDAFTVDRDLLTATRNEKHPLHPVARWDVPDDAAAMQWRMTLLRTFISTTRVAVPSLPPVDGGTTTAKPAVQTEVPVAVAMPAYIADGKRGRVSTRTDDGRTMALAEAAAALDAWVRRYQAFLPAPVLTAARKMAKALGRVNMRRAA